MEQTDKYCTISLAKEYAGDLEGTEEDAFVRTLISAASRFTDKYTHVYWGPSATITGERVKQVLGKWGDCFYTEYAPILSVSSLADNLKTYVEDTDYVVFAAEGRIQILNNSLAQTIASFSDKPGALRITYVVGQGAAKTGEYVSGIAAPEDIQLACAIIAGDWYLERERPGVVSWSRDNQSTQYQKGDIPSKARAILDRRVRLIF